MEKYYMTELHAHTTPASGCSQIEPKELVRIYKENGYDSIVLTNHFTLDLRGENVDEKISLYLNDYYKCCEEAADLGINVILGAEIRFTENNNDYLVFGISPEDLKNIYELLPYGIDNFYREFKNEKNIILQAHPFRDGMVRADKGSIDGIEVFNMHPGHNSRIAFAAKYARENDMIAICGSDFHHHGQDCLCGILTKQPLKDSYDLSSALKSRDYGISIGGYFVSL